MINTWTTKDGHCIYRYYVCTNERADKVELEFTFVNNRRQRRSNADSMAGPAPLPEGFGSLPRITRLMALAIKFEGLIEKGVVRDYADLARLGLVSRARITQIMNLLLLAPDIQEALLFLPRVTSGRDPIREQNLRPSEPTLAPRKRLDPLKRSLGIEFTAPNWT